MPFVTKQPISGQWIAKYYFPGSASYTGEVDSRDVPHGYGLSESNGEKFVGYFANGQRTRGNFTWADGRIYDGDWLDNKEHGIGSYTFVNGDVYEGQFKEGKREDFGKVCFC